MSDINNLKDKYVVHAKRVDYDVYVGRGSKWENPFIIGPDGTRKDVINKYEKYLLNNKELMKSIKELKGKILGCWCAPRACHGDILVKYANK